MPATVVTEPARPTRVLAWSACTAADASAQNPVDRVRKFWGEFF